MPLSDNLPYEADREPGLPHPAEAARIFGHAEAGHIFLTALEANRLPTAWLLTGEKGLGKASLAYDMARQYLGQGLGAEDLAHSNHLVRTRQHPSLYRLVRPWPEGDKKPKSFIPVDHVRELTRRLQHKAAPNISRVVIIDSVDELNLNAANALLKTLEEPPARVMFILVSHQAGRLLPTIRSRARKLLLKALDQASLSQWAAVSPCFDAAAKPIDTALIELAEGVPRHLIQLASTGSEVQKALDDILSAVATGHIQGPDSRLQGFVDNFTVRGAENKRESLWFFLEQKLKYLTRSALTLETGLSTSAKLADLWFLWREERTKAEVYNLDQKSLIMSAILALGRATSVRSAPVKPS